MNLFENKNIDVLKKIMPYSKEIRAFLSDARHTIIMSKEKGKWHISLSHKTRYPTWDELKEMKYHFFPDISMAIIFPPKEEYVNIDTNCFHLYEL